MTSKLDRITINCVTCNELFETTIIIDTGDVFDFFCSDECGYKYYNDRTKYYFFGSENSQDYDVLVTVPYIPQNINDAHDICKHHNELLSKSYHDKELNCNIVTIENNIITKAFKGTCDELNNVLYYTYSNHKQDFPNPIKSPITRDVDEKILRVARFLITFYSRTDLRTEIKNALRGDLKLKLECLKKIDYVSMTEFPGKKEKIEDIYKVIAFQFGQIFSLIDGYESDSYTKNGIIKNYPELTNIINRGNISINDLEALNKHLKRFIGLIESKIETGIKLTETYAINK